MRGGELSDVVSVRIVGHCRPLPLFGIMAGLFGQMDGRLIRLEAAASAQETPQWVVALGSGPHD